ncbi:hypothetical protein GJ496_008298 [Pomphorhynchus laevis]|nr:hypothetical protein GJ496_008298 [Pomphorhynchus laevis]
MCPAKNAVCELRMKNGRIATVCRSEPRKSVNTIQTEADELTTEYILSLLTILSAVSSATLPDTLLEVMINKSLIRSMIDTESKYDSPTEVVKIVDAHPYYSKVLKQGVDTTVSNKHLAPYPRNSGTSTLTLAHHDEANVDHDLTENIADQIQQNTPNVNDLQNNSGVYNCSDDIEKQADKKENVELPSAVQETRIFKRNLRQRRKPLYLNDYL